MNRIDLLFKRLKGEGKKALIPFITAGDPDLATTKGLVFTLEECGAHIIELGVPFSDPLADGPVIQAASLRALGQGVSLGKVLRLVEEIRQGTEIPLVLMTYYNPVFRLGLEKTARQAALAGADGFIIPDLPPEEAGEWRELARANNLDVIFLVAPNTPLSRARFVASKKGIPEGLIHYLRMLRGVTRKPLAVGFGISTPSQVMEIASLSDGVIVGSALVDLVAHYGNKRGGFAHIRSFVKSIAEALP
jgi:tryptophan synthase alpha chain